MLIMKVIAAFILPCLWGFLLAFCIVPTKTTGPWDLMRASCLGVGAVTGLASVSYFVYIFVIDFPAGCYLPMELTVILLSGIFLICKLRVRSRGWASVNGFDDESGSKVLTFARIGFGLVLGLAIVNEIILIQANPYGGWDAWALWTHRAKLLTSCSEHFPSFLAHGFSDHGDYPFLVPAFVSRCWLILGWESSLVPIGVSVTFPLIILGLLMSVVRALKGRSLAYLAGLSLLGTWLFVRLGAYHYSDLALSFFILATLSAILLRQLQYKDQMGLLAISGLCAGFASWTKNEGLLFLVALFVAVILSALFLRRSCNPRRELPLFLLGLAPGFLALCLHKFLFAPPNEIASMSVLAKTLSQTIDTQRLCLILTDYLKELFIFNRWGYMAPILIAYLFISGIDNNSKVKRSVGTTALTCLVMLMGYFFVYLVTPHELQWHLNTSLNRLFMHIWPTTLLACFVIVNRPEDLALGNA